MQVRFSVKLQKQLQEVSRRNSRLVMKTEKKIKLFAQQPNHPSLRLHKLTNFPQDTWSISIDRSIRMVFCYQIEDDQQVAVFFDLGTHDEVYRQ